MYMCISLYLAMNFHLCIFEMIKIWLKSYFVPQSISRVESENGLSASLLTPFSLSPHICLHFYCIDFTYHRQSHKNDASIFPGIFPVLFLLKLWLKPLPSALI